MSSKLFLKYIRNYLGIIGIFLVLLIPVYFAIYQGTERLILTENYARLEQNAVNLDNQISKMSIVTELMRTNEYVKTLAKSEKPSAKDTVPILKVEEFLNSCFSLKAEDFAEYFIFKNNEVIISSNEIVTNSNYQSYNKYGQTDKSFEDFQKLVFESEISTQYVSKKEEDKSSGIVCIIKVLGNRGLNYESALVFEMTPEFLNSVLKMTSNSQTDFAYITNRSGEIIYQINYDGSPLNQEVYNKKKVSLNGQKYNVFQIKGETSGLNWTVGISNKTTELGIIDVNRIIFVYFIVAILGMCLLCVFWAIQRAHAMGGILRILKYDNSVKGKMKNELQFITRGIHDLSDRNERYKANVEVLQRSISESMLEKLLLRGVYSFKEKEEISNYLGWNIEFYCVVCVVTWLKQEEKILDCFCQADKFFEQQFVCATRSVGWNERNYIIQLNADDEPTTRMISNKLKPLLGELEEIQIGISSIGTGLENIQTCYQQAKLAIRQIAGVRDKRIKEYCKQSEASHKIFKLNLGNRIYDLILAEEKDTLGQLFDKIKSYVAGDDWHTDAEIMQFFFEIQNPIVRIWDELEIVNVVVKEMLLYRSDRNLHELIDGLENVAMYLCDCISKRKEDEKNNFYCEMMRFVEENYANKDMCVNFAAEHMGISTKRFVCIFKERTGKNFAAYIEARRMQQVEKYLLETDWNMARIADAVGYSTIDTFYKSFRKIYGLAPGKWKESRKK